MGTWGVVVSGSIFTRRFWLTFITHISRRFEKMRQSSSARQRVGLSSRSQASGRVAMASVLAAGAAQSHADDLIEDGVTSDSLATEGNDYDNVTVTGTGAIDTTGSGIAVSYTSAIANDVTNSGDIIADEHGILIIESSTVGGDITNSGDIIAEDEGIYIYEDSEVGGSIINTVDASITAGAVSYTHLTLPTKA